MLKILVRKYGNMNFDKHFWKLFSFLNKFMVRQKPSRRFFTQEKPMDYKPDSIEFKALQATIKGFSAQLTQIPICIGELHFGSSDVHYQRMPHNTRCMISQMSTGNAKILDHCQRVVEEVQDEWSAVPMKERIEICIKCADILATESRHALNASIMLGQSKTFRQAEEDTCRTINSLRSFAELLTKLESSCDSNVDDDGYIMRASGGFVAAMTPFNWTSQAVNLALAPALMGNCVVWVPSALSMLSSYQVFKALEKAGIPGGVISFVPMNRIYFLNKVTSMPQLSGFNYAGRSLHFDLLASAVSKNMDRPKSFMHMRGPVENKNFHFVHESANVDQVVAATVCAAFDYNGQRGNSCENLFVPQSLWCELKDALCAEIANLHVGDVCDIETSVSAVIDHIAYKRIVEQLRHAETSENCEIVCGGNRKDTHGNFIEPTVVLCKSLDEPLMTKEVQGPLLSVFVYENKELDKILEYLSYSEPSTLAGAVFAENKEVAEELAASLRDAAANLYINKPCIGDTDGHCEEPPGLNQLPIASPLSLLKHW